MKCNFFISGRRINGNKKEIDAFFAKFMQIRRNFLSKLGNIMQKKMCLHCKVEFLPHTKQQQCCSRYCSEEHKKKKTGFSNPFSHPWKMNLNFKEIE